MIPAAPVAQHLPALPRPNQVHLHLLPLDCTDQELNSLRDLLTSAERARCERLLDPLKRQQAMASRGRLRQLLGNYLGEVPQRVLLSEGEFGKLHLSEHLEPDSLCFNLSHAGKYLVIAVSAGSEVGVDLEEIRGDLDFRPMAERYFAPSEQQELFALEPAQQLTAFYRCWTRKEAYLKGTGVGFSQPANSFQVSLAPNVPAALVVHHDHPEESRRWSLRDLPAPAGYCAALAAQIARPELKFYGFRK
ncbi:4'-phosphopantetheinyl transferase [Geomonas limicola]|uniref:4'-phosphopantetheinyl transferase n=1 Tax=Geomonas limicola TaxID=2740186 RepID=A0A6V8NBP3_9BACT|nr:4'-phosphopantetheinyl transferase superfamily protein [Geomonas limicola]GFO69936.1 4'-phosphopantetheinyl transferase [Geomonas limicola]